MTGTRGRQQEAARNDRKVLDAAREVFATQGWDAPVSAVAERAGVGMGSLYRRYGSKTELLQRLCVLAMEQNIAAAEQSLAMDEPWDALSSYVHACVGFSAARHRASASRSVAATSRRTGWGRNVPIGSVWPCEASDSRFDSSGFSSKITRTQNA